MHACFLLDLNSWYIIHFFILVYCLHSAWSIHLSLLSIHAALFTSQNPGPLQDTFLISVPRRTNLKRIGEEPRSGLMGGHWSSGVCVLSNSRNRDGTKDKIIDLHESTWLMIERRKGIAAQSMVPDWVKGYIHQPSISSPGLRRLCSESMTILAARSVGIYWRSKKGNAIPIRSLL